MPQATVCITEEAVFFVFRRLSDGGVIGAELRHYGKEISMSIPTLVGSFDVGVEHERAYVATVITTGARARRAAQVGQAEDLLDKMFNGSPEAADRWSRPAADQQVSLELMRARWSRWGPGLLKALRVLQAVDGA